MNRLTTTVVAVALTLGFAAQASARHCHPRPIYPPVQPMPTAPPPFATPSYYFGMSLQLIPTQYGLGLQIVSVTPGAPASLAGLEPGDVLLASNQTSFNYAHSNQHGVSMLQQSVISQGGGFGGGPVPTSANVIQPRVLPQSMAYTDLQVLDMRSGGVLLERVYPGGGFGGPIPTAGNFTFPSNPVPSVTFPINPTPTQPVPVVKPEPATVGLL